MRNIKRIIKTRESNLLLVTIIIVIFTIIKNPVFLSRANLFGILYYIAENTIIIGSITVLMISRNLDLSVGGMLGFSGILVGVFINNMGLPIVFSIFLTVLVAILIGAFNGFIVGYVGINSLVTTLSTWFILLSLKYIINNGAHASGLPLAFQQIAKYKFFGTNFNSMMLFALSSFIIFAILLRKNVYFRQNYFIGDSYYGAALIGIRVRRVILINYIISSSMCCLAGIFTAARFGTAYTMAGTNTQFIVLAAVILGGVSFFGGKGSVIGAMLGLVFLAILYNVIIIFGINEFLNDVTIGMVILISIIFNIYITKKSDNANRRM